MHRCAFVAAGQVDYAAGLRLQEAARRLVSSQDYDGVLILLEHTPVITIGRGGGAGNLLADSAWLAGRGVDLAYTDRGGNITCHNPGQLVGYPVLNLRRWQPDVHWYAESLEEVLLRTLRRFGLRGGRKTGYTGVWLGDAKIAAIGVAVKKWITSHGFALNVANDLELFRSIVPCGISEFGVTSLAAAGVTTAVTIVAAVLIEEFCRFFDCEVIDNCVEK
ncbi:MAG: lipoyl(octanoyl) transferase LipB [Negativicutes bacterium]|nr:lipoyl(octanoyl) transferase LipB [Negativicutes bacterium]